MSGDDYSATAAAASVATEKCCASCGIAAIDDIKLKSCAKCDLVGYCSDQCQQDHREKHEAACKKRADEMYDEILFKQPENSHLGDCPICCLPMPLDTNKIIVQVCCGKKICRGCGFANYVREIDERLKKHRCPFCRHVLPETEKESDKLRSERAKLNDPSTLALLGFKHKKRGDHKIAFHYFSKAAALGDIESMFNLSVIYDEGQLAKEDKGKRRALLEKAAIAGHPEARYNLGVIEMEDGRFDRAVKHFIVAANRGYENAIKALKECYKDGHVSKDDFAAALRAYQAAIDATKSPQREEAEGIFSDSDSE